MLVLNEMQMRGIAGGYRNVGQISGDIIDGGVAPDVTISGTPISGPEDWNVSTSVFGGDALGGFDLAALGLDLSVQPVDLETYHAIQAAKAAADKEMAQKLAVFKANQKIFDLLHQLQQENKDIKSTLDQIQLATAPVDPNPVTCAALVIGAAASSMGNAYGAAVAALSVFVTAPACAMN